MWLQLLMSSLIGLALAGVYLVASTVIRAHRALNEFKIKSANLPILAGANPLLANHGVEFHMGRNVCNKLKIQHEKYGDTFGFLYGTRPCVSTIDLDLIKLIVHDEPLQHINRMPFNSAMIEFEHDGIFLAEGEQWRRIRRAFGPALRKYKMPNNIAEIEQSVAKLIRSLENKLDAAALAGKRSVRIEADDLVHRYSHDIVFRCLYKQSNLIDYETERCQMVDTVDEALSVTKLPLKSIPIMLCLVFPALIPVIDKLVKKFMKFGQWQTQIMHFIKNQTKMAIEARKYLAERGIRVDEDGQNGAADFDTDNFQLKDGTRFRRSIVDFIIDHYLDGKITRSEYINSSFLLFTAADKTVADAMSHAIYLLATNQGVQDKLRESVLTNGIDSEYLTWVINESLRLHPPAAIGCSRTITRNIQLSNGHLLPAGTYVHTNSYVIHRQKRFWGEDADEFVPERWANSRDFHPMQFLAFGAGRRGCPGRELAMFEMKLLFTNLLSQFELKCAIKQDICLFDSPYMLYTLPNSPTFIELSRK